MIKGRVCGCECAPSFVVANFKLEAFLTRAGDLEQQNNLPMKNTPVCVQRHTPTHTHVASTGTHTYFRLRVAFVRRMRDHPGE